MPFDFKKIQRSVFRIEPCPIRYATGFLLPGGLIATCAHSAVATPLSAFDHDVSYYVTVRAKWSNAAVPAKVLLFDQIHDLMILGSPAFEKRAPFISDEYDAAIKGGQPLQVFEGSEPKDLFRVWVQTCVGTLIQANARIIDGITRGPRALYLQTTSGAIEPGNSGSAILLEDGQAIGMLQAGNNYNADGSGVYLPDVIPPWVLNERKEVVASSFRHALKSRWNVAANRAG